MRRWNRVRLVLAAMVALALFGPQQAFGYIGPGAGFAFVGSFMVLLGAFLAVFAALAVMPIRMVVKWFATRKTRAAAKAQRCVIIGLDGLDPGLLKKYMDEGKMPEFQRLAEAGVFRPLDTTTPRCPRSPGPPS